MAYTRKPATPQPSAAAKWRSETADPPAEQPEDMAEDLGVDGRIDALELLVGGIPGLEARVEEAERRLESITKRYNEVYETMRQLILRTNCQHNFVTSDEGYPECSKCGYAPQTGPSSYEGRYG